MIGGCIKPERLRPPGSRGRSVSGTSESHGPIAVLLAAGVVVLLMTGIGGAVEERSDSYTRADGSTGEVRGPWSELEFALEMDLEAGTTATVRYLDDSAEHGDRAGDAIVLDDGAGPAIPSITPFETH